LLSDAEYLVQKSGLRQDLDDARRDLASVDAQAETWIDDCERFFDFSQWLAAKFQGAPAGEKKAILQIACQNLTLRGTKVAAVYREGYAELAAFPLAGKEAELSAEPVLMAS